MFSSEEILNKKVADRFCRRNLLHSDNIEQIIRECCDDCGIDKPEVIYCETLTRSLSAFYFRNIPYIIYDSCLLEALYIFDGILLGGQEEQDLHKFIYKLVGEELIRNNEIARCLYFSGKYRQLEYLFDKKKEYHHNIIEILSAQSYFLIGHELGHLSVQKHYITNIPDDYCKFINGCMKVLMKSVINDDSQKFIDTHYKYFMNMRPKNIEEYWNGLLKSKKYEHLIEECFCDWNGIKLLLEHYDNPKSSISAISMVFKYLIIQEAIRSDIDNGKFYFDDSEHNASRAMYFSVLRMEIILLTIRINNLNEIEQEFRKVQEQYLLTDCWMNLLKKIPSENVFSSLSDADLPNMDRKKLINILIDIFYYVHVI